MTVGVPFYPGHPGELFGADPENPDDDRVAIDDDDGRDHEHDGELVPGEHHTWRVWPEVRVCACLHHHRARVVVEQSRVCRLKGEKCT